MMVLRSWCITLTFAVLVAASGNKREQTPNILEAGIMTLLQDMKHDLQEPRDDHTLLRNYDFIVVGAGTAGSVIANRLTEIPGWDVLLLEAGPSENFIMDVPIVSSFLQLTGVNWGFKTEPSLSACLGMSGGQCNYPRGKVMGGSSVLSYMIYSRGNRLDYDAWSKMGNTGWSYDEVLPYFLKSEDMQIPGLNRDKTHHKTGGYLTVTYPPYHTPLAQAFLAAGAEVGAKNVDYNAKSQTGFSYLQSTMKNGTRWSASQAFLRPIHARSNLHVKKQSVVTHVLIDHLINKAYGVKFRRGKRRYVVHAKKEVIICAGTINSPKLLMVSGVGPRDHLRDFNIPLIKDLKVGYNLQDHVALGGLIFLVNQSVSMRTDYILQGQNNYVDYIAFHRGPWSIPAGMEALAYVDTDVDGRPDVELLFEGSAIVSDPTFKSQFGIDNEVYKTVFQPIKQAHTWMVYPMLLRPRSRGRIMLRNDNVEAKPLIYHNYLSSPEDIDMIVTGVKKTIQLSRTQAFQKFGSRLHDVKIPSCSQHHFGDDSYWACAARHLTFTMHHQVGTCKMGPSSDKDAVVDPRLRVHGVQGLRVIDASIMPVIPAAHINAPTYMIAEKGADMIKQDWGKFV